MNKLEHRTASNTDWSQLFLNGMPLGDEYEVASQFQAVRDALTLLGIEHKAVQVDLEFDDDTCTWVTE